MTAFITFILLAPGRTAHRATTKSVVQHLIARESIPHVGNGNQDHLSSCILSSVPRVSNTHCHFATYVSGPVSADIVQQIWPRILSLSVASELPAIFIYKKHNLIRVSNNISLLKVNFPLLDVVERQVEWRQKRQSGTDLDQNISSNKLGLRQELCTG